MKPAQGDSVKFTSIFLANSTQWDALKDEELLVTRLKMKTMVPFSIFTVYFMSNNMLYSIDVSSSGHYIDSSHSVTNWIVFEPFTDSASASVTMGAPMNSQSMPTSAPAWTPNAPAHSSPPVTLEEANTTCNKCGAPALDMAVRVKCTNPNCINYR